MAKKKEKYNRKSQRPRNYWKDKGNIRFEFLQLRMELGREPTTQDIQQNLSGLYARIRRDKKKINAIRQIAGTPILRISRNHYRDWDIFSEGMVTTINEIGHFPTRRELIELGNGTLYEVAWKKYGGLRKVKKRLGFVKERKIKKDKLRVSLCVSSVEETLTRIREFMNNHGFETLPSDPVLKKFKQYSLLNAIYKFGGFVEFRKAMGLDEVDLRKQRWKDLKYTLENAREFILNYGYDELPPSRDLVSRGYKSLVKSIYRYHGGFPAFRQKLNEHLERESDESKLIAMLKQYVSRGQDG